MQLVKSIYMCVDVCMYTRYTSTATTSTRYQSAIPGLPGTTLPTYIRKYKDCLYRVHLYSIQTLLMFLGTDRDIPGMYENMYQTGYKSTRGCEVSGTAEQVSFPSCSRSISTTCTDSYTDLVLCRRYFDILSRSVYDIFCVQFIRLKQTPASIFNVHLSFIISYLYLLCFLRISPAFVRQQEAHDAAEVRVPPLRSSKLEGPH